MTCPRWRLTRLAFAALATLWVTLVAPAFALPSALTLTLVAAATLDPARTRPWLDSHAFVLGALMVASSEPLLVVLGAATLPMTAIALFALPIRPRPRVVFVALAAAALTFPALSLAPYAAPLAAFFSLRPLAALGEVLRALGLHRGPVDPLLAWHPLRPPGGAS